ncbi:MAG TPA: anti-sigma factor [Hypericibacter adhaerens]|uniref:Anti-sigma K factor RskA n=1 Tax=Hypericibacter adhaerens TaxID=2602016 RepID=A0A5J6MSG7_9PROT|nr:anti-sigma factor [Hypericibacter adhaerens]QEX20314.1 anti-sigma K factor RskA [Hypericibacter adhaerens]HWA41832.1 anti-sigma factor [Hypericibacter adhaerens]
MTEPNPELLDQLAAEYALGTLRGPARRRFERLIEGDPALARRVEDWAQRLDPLAEGAPAIEPPARSWAEIERRIGAAPPRARRGLLALLFGRPTGPVPSLATAGLWYCLGFWRRAGLAGAAIALLLFVYLFVAPPPTPTHMALLADAASKPVAMVSLDLKHDRLTLDASRLPVAEAGKSLELWILPPQGNPRSLGVLPAGPLSLPLDRAAAADLAHGGLAVSLEPAGGSPTGLPTGPVLYSGAVLPAS